ncbi:hypothetical protein BDB01DRAFT_773613 [Pilobolus umbonatus]|nr:hypothetical protein BDB01DRAFT_773613 [Pilobolus umbonatus]
MKDVTKKEAKVKPVNAKKSTEPKPAATKSTDKETIPTKATTVKSASPKSVDVKLTPAEKLLKSMTAKKLAKQILHSGVKSKHVSFDDAGNEEIIEPVKKASRPVVQKPPKRKTPDTDKSEAETTETPAKPVKKAKKKKEMKTKKEIETAKKENKLEAIIQYVHLFAHDRSSWKFKKLLQIGLLESLYQIPEEHFDDVLLYLKGLQGVARENVRKEAQTKIPKKINALSGYQNVSANDDGDDFDAEKLLNQVAASVPTAAEEIEDSEEVKRARLILSVLS